jgi:hypothetical protein
MKIYERLMFMKRKIKAAAVIAAALVLAAVLCGCGKSAAEYTITVKGSAQESGVIEYAGLEMNVYQDQASNPCGDCPDQPVSIYVGTSADDTAKSMSEAVTRADDVWEVESCRGGVLKLKEKEDSAGTNEKEPELSAPKGLTLTGDFSR